MSAAGRTTFIPENLTPRQLDVKRFIQTYTRGNGHGPSFAEIADGIGVVSKSNIHRLVSELEARGHVTFRPRIACSLRIVEHSCPNCGCSLDAAPLIPAEIHGDRT